MWGVNSNNDIFRRKVDGSSSWIWVPGKLKHVSALGTVTYGESTPTTIYSSARSPAQDHAGWVQVPGKLKQIDGGYMTTSMA